MDFARNQLLKYGWTDGKGLGKHENGISEALKPKLKRSVAGVGYDAASDFTEHWWSQLYDKAAGNVEVEESNGKTKKIKTKDSDGFEITNSTWKMNRKKKGEDGEYSEHFVRKSILTSGGSKMEKLAESDSEEDGKKDVFKMSDEELFAACEGRTAHKGARHGLTALGKLARIAQQEQALLLQPQYQGYTHAEKLKKAKEIVEDTSMNSDFEESVSKKKKKKKRKRCTSLNSSGISGESSKGIQDLAVSQEISMPHEDSMIQEESVASDNNVESSRKGDKSKSADKNMVDLINKEQNSDKHSKKKKKRKNLDLMDFDELMNDNNQSESEVKKRKKKKH